MNAGVEVGDQRGYPWWYSLQGGASRDTAEGDHHREFWGMGGHNGPDHARRGRSGMAATVALVLLMLAAPAVGRGESETPVVVTCDQPELVGGYFARALVYDTALRRFRPTPHEALFTNTGTAQFQLPDGGYVIEALHVTEDAVVVSFRSERFIVPRVTEVTLQGGPPQPVTLAHAGETVTVDQLAVRSAALTGETRWTRDDPVWTPRVALTPGQTYGLNVIGQTGPTHVAGWFEHKASGRDPTLRTASNWREVRFAWRSGTPPTRSATATLIFPDSRLETPVVDETRVITNRAYGMVEYAVELEAGPRLRFQPQGYQLRRKQRLELGGELEPAAWAGFVWAQGAEGWTPYFEWRVSLRDPAGHSVDVSDPAAGVTSTIHRVDGEPAPSGKVDRSIVDALGDLPQTLLARIEWTWNGRQSRELAPQAFTQLRSDHFRIEAVPAWAWQTRNFLTKLERCRLILREITQRPGPRTFNIDWRQNAHNARAAVGGSDWVWCSLPFRTYEHDWDPFHHPAFMVHEMLHNFGYHHGEEMSRLQNDGLFLFGVYRWHLVDNPRLTIPTEPGRPYDDPKARRSR